MSNRIVSHAVVIYLAFAACASAADLRPDQQAAIEKLLATVDPAAREMARATLEQSLTHLTPEQVAMLVARSEANAANNRTQPEPPPKPERVATPEDHAYNRAQIEPALRKHWKAKKAFDDFVTAELAAKCPNRDAYAVYREAERYELMPLSPNWQRAPDREEAEVSVYIDTYSPKDGRYDFDFSKVRMTFDKQVVSNAIAKACADWAKEGATFKQKAQALMNSGQSQAALTLEGSASKKASAINGILEAALKAECPAGEFNEAMMDALREPKSIG